MPRIFIAVALGLLLSLGSGAGWAQSTDGFHSRLVFPVVVDSASFTQSFHFRSFSTSPVLVPRFYPAKGGTPIECPTFGVSQGGSATRLSLREMCPALDPGSVFGMLTITPLAEGLPIGNLQVVSGFSRVSNAAGAGFAVEAFPWHTFTSARGSVDGLARRTASASGPALQSNCFVGMMPSVADDTRSQRIVLSVERADGTIIAGNVVDLVPGQLVRLLDVFASLGAAPGDYQDATFRFEWYYAESEGQTGLIGYCTVQDNTSFNADFRIGKAGQNRYCLGAGCDWDYPMDRMATRRSQTNYDYFLPGQAARLFSLPAGEFQNTHVYYFRHPDVVSCELRPSPNQEPLPAGAGLEMRLLDESALPVAGGDGQVAFYGVQLGDKMARGAGANSRYFLQVERSGENAGEPISYAIACESGSGHTPGDLVRYQVPLDQF